MQFKNSAVGWLVLLVASVVFPAAAPAQRVLTGKTAWTPAPTAPVITFNASMTQSNTQYGNGTSDLLRLQSVGTATQNSYLFYPDQSSFSATNIGTQSFTLTQQAVVQIPMYFTGNISFFGSGSNDSTGTAVATSVIMNSANQNVFTGQLLLGGPASGGNLSTNRAVANFVTLPAGTYTLRDSLFISGKTALNGGGSSGTGVTTDFSSAPYNGFTSLVGAWPTGLNGSRAFVLAPQARTNYGVDGTGVVVGQLEGGRPYIPTDPIAPNAALYTNGDNTQAYKVTLTNNAAASASKERDEHAEAVASIIAGSDANSENAGVAPGATILSAAMSTYAVPGATPAAQVNSVQFRAGFNDLVAAKVNIINMSAYSGATSQTTADTYNDAAFVDQTINAAGNSNLLFVKSAGNTGGLSSPPGMCFNGLAIGALNAAMTAPANFSATGTSVAGGNNFVPQLVAPGTYINAASPLGGFTRTFTAEPFESGYSPASGPITGTSFAAPFVSGTAALIDNYYNNHKANHDIDHRVLKAVLMNSATTAGLTHTDGTTPWKQSTNGGAGTPGNVLEVFGSLDSQLGAGAVNANQALAQYAPNEISGATGNGAQHLTLAGSKGKKLWWDDATVQPSVAIPAGGTDPGTVDYLLGAVSGHIRITLDWDAISDGVDADTTVPDLSLRIYQEGQNANNPLGYDANDVEIAQTDSVVSLGGNDVSGNVGLLDFNLQAFNGVGPFANPNAGDYYVSVQDLGNTAVQFGIAANVPEPASLAAMAILMLCGVRRRPRRYWPN